MPVRNATTIRPASWSGWIPDLPDQRDQLYAKLHAVPKKLPAKVDLRAKCSPIEDQGQLGSCTMPHGISPIEIYRTISGRCASWRTHMRAMVGFRNVAVLQYQDLSMPVLVTSSTTT